MKTTITEEYDQEGNVWITLKLEIPGIPVQSVDFESHFQIAELKNRLQEYLDRRRAFNADIIQPMEASEPLPDDM